MAERAVIRCHCGQFNETVQLQDQIPIESLLCHCNRCRHLMGAMAVSGITLVAAPVEVFQQKLVKYATSDKICGYFCGTCGSQVGYFWTAEDRWNVCPGTILEIIGPSSGNGKLEKYTGHEYVADTIDGGISKCLPSIPCYAEDVEGSVWSNLRESLAHKPDPTTGTHGQDKLHASCHCGGVQFSILRPQSTSEGNHATTSPEKEKWEAVLCICRSCALSAGQPITGWAKDVPFSKVISPDGSVYDRQLHGTLGRFQSSANVTRSFCKTCGASIFYHSSDRGNVLDIAVGILRADDGALARSWLTWLTRPFHSVEDVIDQALVRTLQENMEKLLT